MPSFLSMLRKLLNADPLPPVVVDIPDEEVERAEMESRQLREEYDYLRARSDLARRFDA